MENTSSWTEWGIPEDKAYELLELYREKAMALGMYHDEEAIAAIYRRGIEDAAHCAANMDGLMRQLDPFEVADSIRALVSAPSPT